ncbi:MAG TPA: DUF523 and DUF1722 domain-containing protein [Methylomirabilota bacterium]|nr:DUF523 and DUF1722 domain-containing protein [Methylomirabilota bacterium]
MPAPAPAWRSPDLPIRVGISSCLLGEEVRYDGGHQKDGYITGVLAGHFTWIAVCPELEVGMGVPREPIRLVGDPAAPRLLGVTSGTDHTARMSEFARRRVAALRREGLHGYILKRASPSCGLERVKVYGDGGSPARSGVGLFARALTEALPLLPVEEEGRLNDAHLRENFITRVFAYRRLAALRETAPRPAAVVDFHTAHKYLLLAHSPSAYAQLGRLVAAVPRAPHAGWLDRYGESFMRALAARATVRKHVNVLQHIVGFFKKQLGAAEKRELLGVIADYGAGLVPLVVPITLINHHVARFDVAYVRDQVYLRPHPKELMLRNHV